MGNLLKGQCLGFPSPAALDVDNIKLTQSVPQIIKSLKHGADVDFHPVGQFGGKAPLLVPLGKAQYFRGPYIDREKALSEQLLDLPGKFLGNRLPPGEKMIQRHLLMKGFQQLFSVDGPYNYRGIFTACLQSAAGLFVQHQLHGFQRGEQLVLFHRL